MIPRASLLALFVVQAAACGEPTTKDPRPYLYGDRDGGDSAGPQSGLCTGAPDITAELLQGYSGVGQPATGTLSSCAATSSSRTFLNFTIALPGNFRLSVSGVSGGAHAAAAPAAAVAIRESCNDVATELQCNDRAAFLDTYVGITRPDVYALVLEGDWFLDGFTVRLTPTAGCMSDQICASQYAPQIYCDLDTLACVTELPVLVCAPGTADCDRRASTGCETDTTTSFIHCGECDHSCTVDGNYATIDCVTGTCVLTCDTGTADCDGISSNGCEVFTDRDGRHCGECGYDCGGGACNDSQCGPVPETLATGDFAFALAANTTHLFWTTNHDQVMRLSKAGGPPQQQAFVAHDRVSDLEATDSHLCWIENDWSSNFTLVCQLTSGGAVNELATTTTGDWPVEVAVDATHAYFLDPLALRIRRAELSTGTVSTVVTLASNEQPSALFLSGDTAFWLDGRTSALRSSAKTGGTATTVTTGLVVGADGPPDIAVFGANAYVPLSERVLEVPLSGGTPRTIVDTSYVDRVAAFADGLVWHKWSTPYTLRRTTLSTTATLAIATDTEQAYRLLVDDTHVYWLTWSSLRRVSR